MDALDEVLQRLAGMGGGARFLQRIGFRVHSLQGSFVLKTSNMGNDEILAYLDTCRRNDYVVDKTV